MNILLSNDDSHTSPLLSVAMRKLSSMGKLTVVVPKHEQSWKGKSMSRFQLLHRESLTIDGMEAISIDGTPADCINIGIHHICPEKPDFVVSGINTGLNAGISFVLASGTVGACLEANIAQVPAIALSQMFDSDTMNRYIADYSIPEATVTRLQAQAEFLMGKIFKALLDYKGFYERPITWNVNFPFMADEKTPIRFCSLGHSMYGSCYEWNGEHFKHLLSHVTRDRRDHTDGKLLYGGAVTVTPIDILRFGQIDTVELEELQSIFG